MLAGAAALLALSGQVAANESEEIGAKIYERALVAAAALAMTSKQIHNLKI